jgi:hypothetical protein
MKLKLYTKAELIPVLPFFMRCEKVIRKNH